MNARSLLSLVLAFALALVGAAPSLAQPGRSVGPPAALDQEPAVAGTPGSGPIQFQAGGHVAAFMPGRACLASLDHALCVDFLDSTSMQPRELSFVSLQSKIENLPWTPSGRGAESKIENPPLGQVAYSDLWPGIDLVYTAADGAIAKATYYVAAGADPASIRLRYNLPVAVQADGSLSFELASGRGTLTESAPLAWQEIGGRRVPVSVAFAQDAAGDGTIGFRLGTYDPRYPLTIDPIYQWHTFYGSGAAWGYDYAHGVAVDADGNVYIAGASDYGWNAPAAPLNGHSGDGWPDIVIVKLDREGGYLWHTFYGGGSEIDDIAFDLAVDAAANVYVTGCSEGAWNGPAGQLPKHPYSGSVDGNIVVLKLDTNGAYQWHTYYGLGYAEGSKIRLDGMGGVYVAGESIAPWVGDTGSPRHDHTSSYDLTVLKLTTDGAYDWHTFFGQAGYDYVCALAVDGTGAVYVGGTSDGPWQGGEGGDKNPINPYGAGAYSNIVVMKLDSEGYYEWHTFYGPAAGSMGANRVYGLAVDGAGNIYAAGESDWNWLGDEGQAPLHAYTGDSDIFVLELDGGGHYVWHTFYGNASWDSADGGLALDDAGNIYVAGRSVGTWQGDLGESPLHEASGAAEKIMLLKLTGAGAYQWHTFYGSPAVGNEDASSIVVDAEGSIYVAGRSADTWQGDGGADPLHPFSSPGSGIDDLMVAKFTGDVGLIISPVSGGTIVYTNTQGLTTTLEVPPAVVGGCAELVFTPIYSPTHPFSSTEIYAHHAFLLHAYPCTMLRAYLPLVVKRWAGNEPLWAGESNHRMSDTAKQPQGAGGWAGRLADGPSSVGRRAPRSPAVAPPSILAPGDPFFLEPVTITIHYSDADVGGSVTETLDLVYWTGTGWADMADTCWPPSVYYRDRANNILRLAFCHMSQGAVRR